MAELFKPKLTPKRGIKEIKERSVREKKQHLKNLERIRAEWKEHREISREGLELEKIDAVIEDVRLYTDTSYFVENFEGCYEVKDLWATRPKLYGDTDIIAVTLKPSKGKAITDIFPVVLKFDGTLENTAASRRSRFRRNRFAKFLKHYKIAKKVEDYNILEKISEWKGTKVKMVTYVGRPQIFVPDCLVRNLYPTQGE